MKHEEIKVGMRVRIKNGVGAIKSEKAKRHTYGIVRHIGWYGCFPIGVDYTAASLKGASKRTLLARDWAFAPHELVRA